MASSDPYREHWIQGIEQFNRQRYWHAHECWEQGWNKLPGPERQHVQALIQAAAAFHLIGKGRLSPARSLMDSALRKWEQIQNESGLPEDRPRIEIPGLKENLEDLLSRDDSLFIDLSAIRELRAFLTEP